jgi:hypothetical protein
LSSGGGRFEKIDEKRLHVQETNDIRSKCHKSVVGTDRPSFVRSVEPPPVREIEVLAQRSSTIIATIATIKSLCERISR